MGLIIVLAQLLLNILRHMEGEVLRAECSRKQEQVEGRIDGHFLSWECLIEYGRFFEEGEVRIK